MDAWRTARSCWTAGYMLSSMYTKNHACSSSAPAIVLLVCAENSSSGSSNGSCACMHHTTYMAKEEQLLGQMVQGPPPETLQKHAALSWVQKTRTQRCSAPTFHSRTAAMTANTCFSCDRVAKRGSDLRCVTQRFIEETSASPRQQTHVCFCVYCMDCLPELYVENTTAPTHKIPATDC